MLESSAKKIIKEIIDRLADSNTIRHKIIIDRTKLSGWRCMPDIFENSRLERSVVTVIRDEIWWISVISTFSFLFLKFSLSLFLFLHASETEIFRDYLWTWNFIEKTYILGWKSIYIYIYVLVMSCMIAGNWNLDQVSIRNSMIERYAWERIISGGRVARLVVNSTSS